MCSARTQTSLKTTAAHASAFSAAVAYSGNGCVHGGSAATGAAALIGLGKGQQPMKEHCSKIQNVPVQSWIGRKAGLFQQFRHFTKNLKFVDKKYPIGIQFWHHAQNGRGPW